MQDNRPDGPHRRLSFQAKGPTMCEASPGGRGPALAGSSVSDGAPRCLPKRCLIRINQESGVAGSHPESPGLIAMKSTEISVDTSRRKLVDITESLERFCEGCGDG